MLRRLTLVVLSLAGLGACSEPSATLEPLPDVVAAARPGTPVSLTPTDMPPIVSTGTPPAPAGHRKPAADTADLTFAFVDADIREILHSVLGESLELNYVVDPDVQGTASLETVAPVTRDQALSMLEGVLIQNNAALIKAGPIYRVRSTSSVDASQPMASSTSSGITVIPLRYTGADRVVKLLTPFISPDSGLAGDTSRNVVMVSGNVASRAALIALIQTCDSDMLATQSFALFPVPDGAATKAAEDLQKALQTRDGGALRVVALDRVDAVLVVARDQTGLNAARSLFDLLERGRLATARVWHIYLVHNGSSDDLGKVLRQAYPAAEKRPEQGVRIIADHTRNALAVYATGAEYDAITATLARVDIVPLQVRIDVSVAEVTLGDTLSYGSQFATRNQGLAALLTTGATAAISGASPGFTLARMGSSGPQEIVTALVDATQVRLLSAPQITVANNVQGSIEVGDSVPYVSGSDTSTLFPDAPTVNSVTYAQTGILLQVTPRVSADGLVTLDLVQQISEPEVIAGSPEGSPGFSDRRFKGRAEIQDGQTVAVAGLVDDSRSETNAGIPVLKDVPGVGSLVATESNNRTRTELLVLITPHVIHDQRDARALAEDLRHTLHRAALVKSP